MTKDEAIDVEAERPLFEAAARNDPYAMYCFLLFGNGEIGAGTRIYLDTKTEAAWGIWLAAKRSIAQPTSEAVADLIKRLREHDGARLYAEADLLMHEAANALAAQPAADPAPVIHQSQRIDEWGVESGWVTYTVEQIEALKKEPQGWGYRTVYRTIPTTPDKP